MNNLEHITRWLSLPDATKLYEEATNMGLQQHEVTVWDKVFKQPRLTAWCSDNGIGYHYSGQVTPSVGWPDALLKCRARLENEFKVKLPTCLVNMYRDGQDSVGWHKDDESIFGAKPAIFTVSLGGERKFKLKHKEAGTKDFQLDNGDLLIFTDKYVKDWTHCVPKTQKTVQPRISLTYRSID